MKKYIWILIVLVLISTVIAGCGRKISESIIEKVIEKSSDGEVDIDIKKGEVTIKDKDGDKIEVKSDDDGTVIKDDKGNVIIAGGDQAEWPKDAPDEFPIWKGKIDGIVVMGSTNYMLTIDDVDKDDVLKYVELLEKNKFDQTMKMEMDEILVYTYLKNEKYFVQVSYDSDEDAVILTLAINEE